MITVPTPHNEAKQGDIANIVIMPGDPLRAKYIAEKYLEDVICYNKVRNMYGFTGTYKGIRISVQASGMGIPSMAIYSKELFEGYNVDTIIRVGSAANLSSDIKLRDIVVSESVDSDSNYLSAIGLNNNESMFADSYLINNIKEYVNINKLENISIGKTFSSIVFYDSKEHLQKLAEDEYLALEMEALALYANAKIANKKALSMFTISDDIITGQNLSSNERQESFDEMIKLALSLIEKCENEGK